MTIINLVFILKVQADAVGFALLNFNYKIMMNPETVVQEKDKELWKKIKRNGNFSKKKKALMQQAKKFRVNTIETSAFNTENATSTTFRNFVIQEPLQSLEHRVNSYENVEVFCNRSDEIECESDDSFENLEKQDMLSFREELKSWALTFQIKHTALNALLIILKSHVPDNVLPKDARTLVSTPRNTEVKSDNLGGEYWHYGLQKVLEDTLTQFDNIPSEISLNINIDGLPTFKSSTCSFWPILVNVHEMTQHVSPLVVGIFCGECK